MIGRLPTTLCVDGQSYNINADFRNVLQICAAFNDGELNDNEKAYVCMKLLYPEFEKIPVDAYRAAYESAVRFIECNSPHENRKSPRLIDWEHDESIIFPAINRVAGMEVRLQEFVHWWTFMGYFQAIDHDGLLGYVLMIRDKKARGKKLEKHEKDFLHANAELCRIDGHAAQGKNAQTAEDELSKMFDSLINENGGD